MQASQSLTLDFRQSCKKTPGQETKEPFVIPIELGLIGENGEALALAADGEDAASAQELAQGVIELKDEQRRVRFRNLPRRPVVSAAARLLGAGAACL